MYKSWSHYNYIYIKKQQERNEVSVVPNPAPPVVTTAILTEDSSNLATENNELILQD